MLAKALRVLCLCSVLIGQPGAAVQDKAVTESAAQNQRRARGVIEQMVTVLGGNAYLGLQSSESDGRVGRFSHERSEGSTQFHRYWEWPDKERVELTKLRDVAQLIVGGSMYEITFRGSRAIDPQKDYDARISLERRRHALEIVLRQWLNEPGVAMFDNGPSLTENHSVEQVHIIRANNENVMLSIDSASHLPVKKTFEVRDPEGIRDEIGEIYDNWKMVQGVNTPFNTLVTRNGELQRQYFLSSIAYNGALAGSLFVAGAQSSPGHN